MKLTKSKLKQLIKEELRKVLMEGGVSPNDVKILAQKNACKATGTISWTTQCDGLPDGCRLQAIIMGKAPGDKDAARLQLYKGWQNTWYKAISSSYANDLDTLKNKEGQVFDKNAMKWVMDDLNNADARFKDFLMKFDGRLLASGLGQAISNSFKYTRCE